MRLALSSALPPIPNLVDAVPILRAEAATVLAASLVAYGSSDGSWPWFVGLFLLPDLGMLGYLAGPRSGARLYNLAHTYLAPALLGIGGLLLGAPALSEGALVWIAHIAFDRLAGYGLKDATSFRSTHLGALGPGRV